MSKSTYFLGTKVRTLRKRLGLTMEDLSARCVKVDSRSAPSVSYLSMIERGKRTPSQETLAVIAAVFQKDPSWFLDDTADDGVVAVRNERGGPDGMVLEPSFLFSPENLQLALPDLLSQAAVSGREFAHLLIRSHQEYHQNRFPSLERTAEKVGKKDMNLTVEDLTKICIDLGMKVEWIDVEPRRETTGVGSETNVIVRSYFETPNVIKVNRIMESHPERLRYDLATHIGHWVLHDGDGVRSRIYAGSTILYGRDGLPAAKPPTPETSPLHSQDILRAWRDFECSFFAGALLCPRVPFRRLLNQYAHDVSIARKLQVSRSVVMRRMTVVSPYRDWHYLDAYRPGRFKAVYRGDGIPLPWGNMRLAEDPCPQWAVFRKTAVEQFSGPRGSDEVGVPFAQLSILDTDNGPHLYACVSVLEQDLADNSHVICAGIDLNPALGSQGTDADDVAHSVLDSASSDGWTEDLPKGARSELISVAKLLNIEWVERAVDSPAQVICVRRRSCPRNPRCW